MDKRREEIRKDLPLSIDPVRGKKTLMTGRKRRGGHRLVFDLPGEGGGGEKRISTYILKTSLLPWTKTRGKEGEGKKSPVLPNRQGGRKEKRGATVRRSERREENH